MPLFHKTQKTQIQTLIAIFSQQKLAKGQVSEISGQTTRVTKSLLCPRPRNDHDKDEVKVLISEA